MRRESPGSGLVAGVAILAIGVILWGDHLGRLNARDYVQWWPVILIASGAVHLFERRWSGLIAVGLGLLFLPHVPFFPHIRVSQILELWPLLVSVAGVTLVMQAVRPAMKDPRASTFRAIAVMGGSGRGVGSSEYIAGDAIAVMGGCEIDFTSSSNVREAVVDVLAFWGGIEVKVPRGWRVEVRTAPILGAVVVNAAQAMDPDAPRLVLRGSVIMGGMEVKNPKEERA